MFVTCWAKKGPRLIGNVFQLSCLVNFQPVVSLMLEDLRTPTPVSAKRKQEVGESTQR